MKNWISIKEIISNSQKKGRARKQFLLDFIRTRIEECFGKEETFDLDFHNKILEVKTDSSLLAQEFFLKREEIKKVINKLLEKSDFSGEEIKKIIIKRK